MANAGHMISQRRIYAMLGYWGLPETTRENLSSDGYLFILHRIKEMIISGGENIYPAEGKSAVFGHPDIVDAAVIGVPDATWDEAVKAIDFVESIPRNTAGKILRRVVREPY